eukprot:jgi/Tetstr1/431127/TSEL_020842.t2
MAAAGELQLELGTETQVPEYDEAAAGLTGAAATSPVADGGVVAPNESLESESGAPAADCDDGAAAGAAPEAAPARTEDTADEERPAAYASDVPSSPAARPAGGMFDELSEDNEDEEGGDSPACTPGAGPSPPRAAKAFSRLRRKVDGSASPPPLPAASSPVESPSPVLRRRQALADSDSEDDAEGEALGVGARPTRSDSGSQQQGGDEEGDEKDGAAEEETAPPSVEELNRRTQYALREHGKSSCVGGSFRPEIKPLGGILAKLKQRYEDATKRAPVVELKEEDAPPPPLDLEEVRRMLADPDAFAAAGEDGQDDALIIEDSEPEVSPEAIDLERESEPFDESLETEGAEEEEEEDGEEEEEEEEGVGRAAPVLLGKAKRSRFGALFGRTQLSEDKLARLDFATADRQAVPLKLETGEEEEEEEEEVEEFDFEAMEGGSDYEQEEGEEGAEEEDAGEEAEEEDEAMEEKAEEEGGVEQEGEEEGAVLPARRRGNVQLGDMSDEEEGEGGPAAVRGTVRPPSLPPSAAGPSGFVEMEAEMSDDEGHEDDGDDSDAEDGMLKGLIGTAREGKRDEAIRAKMHAAWEAERDDEELRLAMQARKRGYRRGATGSDDEDEDRAARRRRAAAAGSDDEEGGLLDNLAAVVDLEREDDWDEAEEEAPRGGLDLDLGKENANHSALDLALEEDLDEGSQGMMRLLESCGMSRASENATKTGMARHGSSRLGLFDATNHEASNHASLLGRAAAPSAAAGKAAPRATFTFLMGRNKPDAALPREAAPPPPEPELPHSQPSQGANLPSIIADKAATSFGGLLSGKHPPAGGTARAGKSSFLVNMLQKQGSCGAEDGPGVAPAGSVALNLSAVLAVKSRK